MSGIKTINPANPGLKRPFRLSDLQNVWDGLTEALASETLNSITTIKIVSGLHIFGGELTPGVIAYKGKLYYYEGETSDNGGFSEGDDMYVATIDDDDRTLSTGRVQPFYLNNVIRNSRVNSYAIRILTNVTETALSRFRYIPYVDGGAIVNNTITGEKLVNGSVTTDKIADAAVTTDKIADDAVTADKIADDAVTADEIANGAVGNAQIADGSVTPVKCNAAPFVRPRHANTNDDISLMYFTSGTTGEPKMVAHDFTYPLGHIVTGSFWHNLNENSLHLTIADTGWGKAVWGKLYGQWIAGANIFVYDHEKFTPAAILEKIQEYHVTSLCAPPTIFRFLIHEDLTKFDLSSLKYCTIAGEALNPAVFETFKKLTGIKLMEGFGQTETTLTIATMPWMEPKPGSMGLPNPQYDVDLIDHEGRSVEAGEQGQIVIRTSKGKPLGLFKEYYRDAERTHEAWHDGIYYTGDVAWKDEDGYLWFVGRADDVIKSSGYRIGPFEVESALMTHPAVVECAITGVPDEIRGQVVKATIVLSKDYKARAGEELIKELQNHVKKVTAPYKYPRVIEFVEELPKTISGKIRRVEIRENDKK